MYIYVCIYTHHCMCTWAAPVVCSESYASIALTSPFSNADIALAIGPDFRKYVDFALTVLNEASQANIAKVCV